MAQLEMKALPPAEPGSDFQKPPEPTGPKEGKEYKHEMTWHGKNGFAKFTDVTRQDILDAIRHKGLDHWGAAKLAGISRNTIKHWLFLGLRELEFFYKAAENDPELELGPYAQFYLDVQRAEATYESELLAEWHECAKDAGNPNRWIAVKELLKYRFPDKYGSKSTVAVEQTKTVNINISEVDGKDWSGSQEAVETEFAPME